MRSSQSSRPPKSIACLYILSILSLSNAFFSTTQPTFGVLSSSATTTTSTSLFASASKTKKKKASSTVLQKNASKGGRGGPGRSLSEDELNEHVAARYINGPGGPLDSKVKSRGVTESQEEEQAQFLRELNKRPALVLNADFQPLTYLPLSLWSWQDAIKAIFSGKVQVVDVYPEIAVRAANLEVPLPSVIALTDYVAHKNQRPAFTRRNVFLRDEYKCQYCNERFHTADLSLDHVKPRCMGGILTWENAVTSCLKCNGRKGSLPVSQLRSVGMKLVREPTCPTQMELAAKAARMVPRRVHPTWKPYLGIAETPKDKMRSNKDGDEDFIDDRYFEIEE